MALIPALIVTALVAMMGLSMLMAHLRGARVVNFQGDEFKLTSAVESVGVLTTQRIWSAYLDQSDGVAGDIQGFRNFLTSVAEPQIPNNADPSPPDVNDGIDFLAEIDLPTDLDGDPIYDDVNIDALRVYRHDEEIDDATHLYVTISASTKRGGDMVNPILNRAIRLVYTIEPVRFAGFDYGVLANNVNCIFCHTVVDSTERYYNPFPDEYGTFERIKVGTLESLMVRDDVDGIPFVINDWDADSYVAGSVYVRGPVTDHDGSPITNWNGQSFRAFDFDGQGHIVEDLDDGDLHPIVFSPAGDPPQPLENLYLDYPTAYPDMVDGPLPTSFPPPFPDDGGIDPDTGEPDPTGAGNRAVDPGEFYALAEWAEGTVAGGAINATAHGADPIDNSSEMNQALTVGNRPSLGSGTIANVILTGTESDPIVIDGDVAIDGDVVISGYVKGKGTIYATGNVYIPTDLVYLDGELIVDGDPTGFRTYGVGPDGTKNALGLAAGGNVMIGDYLMPSLFTDPEQYDIVSGDSDGEWNFALAELSLFNRGEWAKTQETLPGPGEDPMDTTTWTVDNPGYIDGYMPRYYNFGPGDEIPIYNLGDLYFDVTTGTWHGDSEVPLDWDPRDITMWDPTDTNNPALFDPDTDEPIAAISQLTSNEGWVSDDMLKLAIELFEGQHEVGDPMEIDALLYTNNAIFGIVHRQDAYRGQLLVNGALVCSDLGLLAPGLFDPMGIGSGSHPPGSPFRVGLRLNYDRRLRDELNIKNPGQVTIKRKLWNPAANIM